MECMIDRNTKKILTKFYNQKNRFYHTIKHITDMVNSFDNLCCKNTEILNYFDIDRKNDFYMGILFHDVVYNGKPSDISESVNVMKSLLKPEEHDISYIQTLIEATSHGEKKIKSFDEGLIHDLDLMILGQDVPTYEEYALNIRKEYSSIPDDEYNKGRIDFIDSILYEPIYCTKYFKEYEEQAKMNLHREKDKLSLSLTNNVTRFFNYISVDRTYITADEVFKLMELLNKEHDEKIEVSLNSNDFVHDILSIFINGMETNKFKTITEKDISAIFEQG